MVRKHHGLVCYFLWLGLWHFKVFESKVLRRICVHNVDEMFRISSIYNK